MALTILNHFQGLNGFMSDNEAFRRVYEDHLELLRVRPDTAQMPVTEKQLDVHQYNWIGLLKELNIPQNMHWFTIRLNNSANWSDIPKDMRVVLYPNPKFIQSLFSTHVSTSKNRRTV